MAQPGHYLQFPLRRLCARLPFAHWQKLNILMRDRTPDGSRHRRQDIDTAEAVGIETSDDPVSADAQQPGIGAMAPHAASSADIMDAPTTILLVEDDEIIAEPLIFGLQDEGFRVFHATDGRQGLELARAKQPALILLDVMLPGMDGFAVCRALRRESAVPIIMLTARGQELDRVMGLELGADDYIVKPFSFRELLARVRALLRRRELDLGSAAPSSDRIGVGDILLDRTARQVWRAGQLIELRQREFDLLCALMEHTGQALQRHELLDKVWGENWIGDPRTLDVHIRWLREKVEDNPSAPRYIRTIRGYGYRFEDPDAPPPDTV